MKNRKRLIILGIFLILILSPYIAKNIIQAVFPTKQRIAFANFKNELITEILIEKEADRTILFKKNNQWLLKKNQVDYPADPEAIKNIIEGTKNLIKEEIVSNNPKKFNEFGVNKFKIILKDIHGQSFELAIGDSPSFQKNYIKIGNENEVFIGEGLYQIKFQDDFRNKKISLVKSTKQVDEIKINYQGKSLIIKKRDQDWYSHNNNKLKKESVNQFITDLTALNANDIIIKQNNDPNLPLPELIIEIIENSEKKIFKFSKKDENNFLLTSEKLDFNYLIPSYLISSLVKEEKDLEN